MDDINSLSKTPTKNIETDDPYQLPDTPSSLASSYNQYDGDVIYPLRSTKQGKTFHVGMENANESINSLASNSTAEFTNRIKYNPLHDSIESLVSNHQTHNKSMIADFQDIKAMIDRKHKEQSGVINNGDDTDLIQKWLADRKRWDAIRQTYEHKLVEMQNTLQNKTLYFNKQETKYEKEIKNLNQQIKSFQCQQNKQFIKLDNDYQELSENNRELNVKFQDLQQLIDEKENTISNLQMKFNEKDLIINKLEIENKNIQTNNNKNLNIISVQMNEYKKENERLKHLELTSQNMVERLLKRLEQQIHSSENIQKQCNLKQEEYETEIIKLEKINTKLQKQLTFFNEKHKFSNSLSNSSSQSSIFTLSSVMTTEQNNAQTKKYYQDINLLRRENKCLRETVNKFRAVINLDKENTNINKISNKIKQFAKQTVLIEKLKNEIMKKDKNLKEYKHSINQFEIIISNQKETIHNSDHTINNSRNNISILEKKNSDISLELIEERSLRQRLEKEIEDLQFESKQLKYKLIAFKNFAPQTHIIEQNCHENNTHVQQNIHGTDICNDEIFGYITQELGQELSGGRISDATRPASANNVNKDRLLLNSLKNLIHKFTNNNNISHSAPNINMSPKYDTQKQHKQKQNIAIKNQHRFHTPKHTLVDTGNFIHKTIDALNNNNNNNNKLSKKSRRRISSMTPVSYLYDANNNKTARNISMKRKRNTNKNNKINNECVSIYRNKIKKTSKLRCRNNKSKIIKVPTSTKVKGKRLISKRKRKKVSQSVSKRRVLKPCMHKHWVN